MSDFRDILKSQKLEMNPKAWEQMEVLLNQAQPKRKNVFLWWILLGIFGAILFGITLGSDMFNTQHSKSVDLGENNTIEELPLKQNNEQYKFQQSTQDAILSTNQNFFDNKKIEFNPKKIMDKTHIDVQNDHSPTLNKTQQLSSNNTNIKSIDTVGNYSDNSLISNSKFDKLYFGIEDYFGTKEDSSVRIIIKNDQVLQSSSILEKDERSNDIVSFDSIGKIQSLISMDHTISFDQPIVKVNQPNRKMFLTSSIGYIYFNQNPGYQYGLGLLKGQNRLIGFGVECLYSHGEARTNIVPHTFENQLDFNATIQLNFLRTLRHKLYIDLSLGYTLYSGQRVIDDATQYIDIRSSTGWNQNFGIGYAYYLKRDQFIGLKLGYTSYDDGISALCFKYGKSF